MPKTTYNSQVTVLLTLKKVTNSIYVKTCMFMVLYCQAAYNQAVLWPEKLVYQIHSDEVKAALIDWF